MKKLKEVAKDVTTTAVMGVKRMAVTICCVFTIGAVDAYHTYSMEPMGAGTITAITLIAALGGVDVWKNVLLKKGANV